MDGKRKKDRARVIAAHMFSKYGLQYSQFLRMLRAQNFRCLICETVFTHGNVQGVKPAIDHCHKTGQVRGLVCGRCNSVLGFARDSIWVLAKAIKYLQKEHVIPPVDPCCDIDFKSRRLVQDVQNA